MIFFPQILKNIIIYINMSERIIIHYIYLLIEREFLNSGEPVYTIGRSRRSHKKTTLLTQRVCEYPKGSKCILCRIVGDCYLAEDTIKKTFSQIFIQRKDIGIEYFEGDIELMKLEFIKIAKEYAIVIDENDININIDINNSDVNNSDVNNSDVINIDINNSDVNNSDVNNSDVNNSDVDIEQLSVDMNLEKKNILVKQNNEKVPKKVNCCEKCSATFKKKCDYDRHLIKKIPCGKEEKEQYDIAKRTCLHCKELYASPKSLVQHLPVCKKRPNENDELKQIITQLSNKLNEQSNKLYEQNNKISIMSRQIKEINTIQKYTL
jgi:hypothetical protein